MEKIDTLKRKTGAQNTRNLAIGLRKTGRTYRETGEILGVHLTNVCKWWKAYERGGQKAVRYKQR
jgi:transposase